MSRKSVICGLPALEVARVRVLGADQKKSVLFGRDCFSAEPEGNQGSLCQARYSFLSNLFLRKDSEE